MLKTMARTLTALTLTINSVPVFAGLKDAGPSYPRTGCDKSLIRGIYDNQNSELMDAVRSYYEEGKTHGWSEQQFCDWLRDRYDGKTEARFGDCLNSSCGNPEPRTAEVDRSFPPDVRGRFRAMAAPPPPPPRVDVVREDGFGSFLQSPFMGALFGGAIGGFFGTLVAGGMNNNRYQQQQAQYFPNPQWPPGMAGMYPGARPWYGSGAGQSGLVPRPWPGAGGGAAYLGGAGYNYNNGGASYGGLMAPPVLPLVPQSSGYSVMGSIPQNHWRLINPAGSSPFGG